MKVAPHVGQNWNQYKCPSLTKIAGEINPSYRINSQYLGSVVPLAMFGFLFTSPEESFLGSALLCFCLVNMWTVACEEIMKVGRWVKATLARGAFPSRHQRCVGPTERSHQRWPHGGRCAGAQRGARSIYKDERFQPLVVSSGQRDGEPAGSGPKVSQIFQFKEFKKES